MADDVLDDLEERIAESERRLQEARKYLNILKKAGEEDRELERRFAEEKQRLRRFKRALKSERK